jgi:hypothetical protein
VSAFVHERKLYRPAFRHFIHASNFEPRHAKSLLRMPARDNHQDTKSPRRSSSLCLGEFFVAGIYRMAG